MAKRWTAGMAVASMLTLMPGAVTGQAYPTKAIRIVTAPAGAGNDFVARVIAQGLTGGLGQQLVVDNRPAGIVGELVAKSPPDGYTLLALGSVLWLTPLLQDNVGYDPVRDFAPISLTARSVNLLVIHPSVPAGSVKQLIALARARPGELNYATGATGASNHLAAELFNSMARIKMVRIAYKGSGPAINDMISGQVHVMFPTTAAGLPHVKTGRLKALGVTSLQPSALAPGLPALAESGLPGYESVVLTEPIKDSKGTVLGSIETSDYGSQVLRDAAGKIRGYYDPTTDHTRGPDKRILAKGNVLRTLIC